MKSRRDFFADFFREAAGNGEPLSDTVATDELYHRIMAIGCDPGTMSPKEMRKIIAAYDKEQHSPQG